MATSGSNGERAAHGEGADQRGRDADQPTEIPPTGWKDVLTRVRTEAKDDGVTLMGAGVALDALLALVPGLVALISIYGLLAEPSDVTEQVTSTLSAAPAEVRELVTAQLEEIVASAGGDAVVGAILGIVLALWSASSGVGHVIEAINRAVRREGDARLRQAEGHLAGAHDRVGAVHGRGVRDRCRAPGAAWPRPVSAQAVGSSSGPCGGCCSSVG